MSTAIKAAVLTTIALLAASPGKAVQTEQIVSAAPSHAALTQALAAANPAPADITQDAALTPLKTAPVKPAFNIEAKIGIARLDKGRLIPAPLGELQDWAFLDTRSPAQFAPISPAAHVRTLPDIPMDGRDSDNRIDEIRMTASDLKMDYVLIYALGADAAWGGIGGKAMIETGLQASADTASPAAPAKAMLVDTYTGEIYGTVTASEARFGVGELTDNVDALIKGLIAQAPRQEA